MKRANFPARQEQRRKDAEERQAERDKRSPQQQINRLRAGGFSAKKEITRLTKLI